MIEASVMLTDNIPIAQNSWLTSSLSIHEFVKLTTTNNTANRVNDNVILFVRLNTVYIIFKST